MPTSAPDDSRDEEEEGDDWETKDWDDELEELESHDAPTILEMSADAEEKEGKGARSKDDSVSCGARGYRPPIVCVMGHVDAGKTKLLDRIRCTNVQKGEAGGITQQIGATFLPGAALLEQTRKVEPDFELCVPGILAIDTPGHEAFGNLRTRGSSLCDIAVVVVDITRGLQPQTMESLKMLKKRKCPFVVALNKIDRMYSWRSGEYTSGRASLQKQESCVQDEFQTRLEATKLQLNECGFNCALWWENRHHRSVVSIVPTSARTGEGVPDLLYTLLFLMQTVIPKCLEVQEELECTVIEVKSIDGLGTTVDALLVNGTLSEGDTIVLAGTSGPIVTKVRALLTPQPMMEMRVKSDYVHHARISTSMGIKIAATGLEDAIAGTQVLVCGSGDDIEELKSEVERNVGGILKGFEKQSDGVLVKASTLGSLEALLSLLQTEKIPFCDFDIGEVLKKDVRRAATAKTHKAIFAFDVKVSSEARAQAARDGVRVVAADLIYGLFDEVVAYMRKAREARKTEARREAVFPVRLRVLPDCVFNKSDPIILGADVVAGVLKVGTPLCIPSKGFLQIGRVVSIQANHKQVEAARVGASVAVKIESAGGCQPRVAYGRHFDASSELVSSISRESVDAMEHFADEMTREDLELLAALACVFKIP